MLESWFFWFLVGVLAVGLLGLVGRTRPATEEEEDMSHWD